MGPFFKITLPGGKQYVVVSAGGFAGLLDLLEGVPDKENTYVANISTWEYAKHVVKSIFCKRRNQK